MANPEHLRILEQGVGAWKAWREKHPDVGPDLSGANLRGAGLEEANLAVADLRGADLLGANLNHAILVFADLESANLKGADLEGANLTGANLREADLSGAWLVDATLARAILTEANLTHAVLVDTFFADSEGQGAVLTRAILKKAVFTRLDNASHPSFLQLACAKGLDEAVFDNPKFFPHYLEEAFEYAHRPDLEEAKQWPNFLAKTLENIKYLRSVLDATSEPPQALAQVVQHITAELINHLKKHPRELYQIKPRQFEELIAEILASYGWDVQLTPPTKDGGYDIFAVSKDIAGVTTSWIIECKKYREDRKIGVDIVRALYGSQVFMERGGASMMLATTSYFTEGARQFKASRYDLELKDYESILEWINEYRPNPDGKLYIKDNRLILPGDE